MTFLSTLLGWVYKLTFWLTVAGVGVFWLGHFGFLGFLSWPAQIAFLVGAFGLCGERFKLGLSTSPASPPPTAVK